MSARKKRHMRTTSIFWGTLRAGSVRWHFIVPCPEPDQETSEEDWAESCISLRLNNKL